MTILNKKKNILFFKRIKCSDFKKKRGFEILSGKISNQILNFKITK